MNEPARVALRLRRKYPPYVIAHTCDEHVLKKTAWDGENILVMTPPWFGFKTYNAICISLRHVHDNKSDFLLIYIRPRYSTTCASCRGLKRNSIIFLSAKSLRQARGCQGRIHQATGCNFVSRLEGVCKRSARGALK